MASILKQIGDSYNSIWELRDRRVDGWFLMSSPLPTFIICLIYIILVKIWGPNYMTNRPAIQLNNVLIFYNCFHVLFSGCMFSHIARGCWWYYFSKFTEFFYTFFFVLRKKNNQISVLHVIHHGIMPMSVWFGVRFTPGGRAIFFGMINSFVHIIMYLYYMLSAMGPKYAKFIIWKKYLTAIQLAQFVAVFIHSFQLFFIECNFPIIFAWWIGGHGVLFLILFLNFFVNAYINQGGNRKSHLIFGYSGGTRSNNKIK